MASSDSTVETRKVQLTGSSTFTVSLPKEWASSNDIEPGMHLRLCPMNDGALLVTADGVSESTGSTLDVADWSPSSLARTVESAYTVGHDRVRLVGDDISDAHRRAVAAAVDGLMGFEVVDETDDGIELRYLLDTPELSIERTVARLQFLALSLLRDAASALSEPGDDVALRAANRADDAHRQATLVRRYHNRLLSDPDALTRLDGNRADIADYALVAECLDAVADDAGVITKLAADLDDVWSDSDAADDLSAITRTAGDLLEDAIDALYDGDRALAHHTLDACEELNDDLEAIERGLWGQGDDAYELGRVVDYVRRTIEQIRRLVDRAGCVSVR